MTPESIDDSGLLFRQDPQRAPSFFSDPDVGRLLAMVNVLAGEVAVLRARLDTHERLAGAAGVFDRAKVEAYAPDAAAFAERQAETKALIARVCRPLTDAVEALVDDEKAAATLAARVAASPR